MSRFKDKCGMLKDLACRAEMYGGCSVIDELIAIGVPVIPGLSKKVLDVVAEKPELFNMGGWHSYVDEHNLGCGTAHCIAGWSTTMAGIAGEELEDAVGYESAGVLIFAASEPTIPIPRFYDSNEGGLKQIQERVETLYGESDDE